MAKWQYTRAESWRYPSLGFAATFGDVLEADFAPDANWDEVDGGTAATLPPVDTSNFTEPAAGTIPVYNAVTNRAEYKTLAELELLTQTEQDARYASSAMLAPGVSLTNPRGLRRWTFALADAQRGTATVACVGDSITYGAGSNDTASTDAPATFRTEGWVATMRSLFARDHDAAGEGYIYPYSGLYSLAGGAYIHPSSGPYEAAVRMAGTGQTMTVTVSDADTVHFYTWNGGSGTCSYTVDGGGAVNFSGGPGDLNSLTWTKHTISGLSTGTSHTIVISGPASGTLYVAGVDVRKGTKGVIVHRLGRSGNTTPNLLGEDSANVANTAGKARLAAAWSQVIPSKLYVLALGTNDFSMQNSLDPTTNVQPGTTPTTYRANVQSFVNARVAEGACVLLVGEPRTPNSPTPATYPQDDYFAAARDVAATTDHCAYLDVAALWGSAAEGFALGLYPTGSTVHPSRKGHGSIAHLVHRALTMPLGVNAPSA